MPSPTAQEAAARIRALDEAWLDAAARRDLSAMMANYAVNAQELLPDMPAIVGRDSIRAFYESVIEQLPRFTHDFAPEDITVASSGDLAVVRGTYRFTPDTLKPQEVQEGKYVGVWRYDDGEWRLFINISNTSKPGPGS